MQFLVEKTQLMLVDYSTLQDNKASFPTAPKMRNFSHPLTSNIT